MIPVVDLFAGPGGLNEGFSSVRDAEDQPVFNTVASFEMEQQAHATLTLRSAFRKLRDRGEEGAYYEFVRGERSWTDFVAQEPVAKAFGEAQQDCHRLRLGPDSRPETERLIRRALSAGQPRSAADWVLIGGPPCQAYSLVGRARRTRDATFENDEKHFLFREYLHIIRKFAPSVFIMENVKGLLSSTHKGRRMFQMIMQDLSEPGGGLSYEIRSLVVPPGLWPSTPSDFIIRSERYGVPQRRHRVILLGVRRDLAETVRRAALAEAPFVAVEDAIGDLPRLRSGISPKSEDSDSAWRATAEHAQELAAQDLGGSRRMIRRNLSRGAPYVQDLGASGPEDERLREWVHDPRLGGHLQHETRAHMKEDLLRYGYLSRMAELKHRSISLSELPGSLLPGHKNVGRADAPFLDRFRVQLAKSPSTTVVSHIAKDGHYYIHYDSGQMRSLTVREAARLQTFPDNYFFMGGRTHQYQQVGNAVPPLLAMQIGQVVREMLAPDS